MSRVSNLPNAKQMRRLGFTNRVEGQWYFCRSVGYDTTFNLTIWKESGAYDITILNESFGQPEYYGNMREVYKNQIMANIDVIVYELNRDGIEVEINHAEYGVK